MLLSTDLLSYSLRRTGWLRFASTFFIFFSQIIVTEFGLGLFSALNGFSLFLLNIGVTTGILITIYKVFGRRIFKEYLLNLRSAPTRLWQLLRRDPFWILLSCVALLLVSWIVFIGLLFPATDFDGNSYHLTFIANVIQNHNFFDAPTSLLWLNGYPKGGEFIGMWNMLIPHTDTLVDLAQVPFLILGIYALYETATALGADKKQARFSALLFLFIPVVLNQLKTTYVDVMLSALFFAGLAMLVKKRLGKLDLLIVGIIFSLLIATKSAGVLFIIVLLPLLLWKLFKNRDRKRGNIINSYIKPLLLTALPTVFGLYWYVKNLIAYGSPIYPFGFKLAGISIFPGKTFQEFADAAVNPATSVLPSGCVERIWFVWTEQKDWFGCLYNYDTNYAGLGPIWLIVLVPAVIIALYYAIKKRNTLYFAVTGTILALFLVYPANYYSRYTMFITGIGILSLAIVLTNVHKITAGITKGLVVVLAVSVFATNIALCNYPPQIIKAQVKSLSSDSPRGEVYNSPTWQAFTFLENRLRAGEAVAYDSSPYFIYPLWKPDYSTKVIYLPAINATEWYKKLDQGKIRYVFTTKKSLENGWAKDNKGMQNIYKDQMYEIYQIY